MARRGAACFWAARASRGCPRRPRPRRLLLNKGKAKDRAFEGQRTLALENFRRMGGKQGEVLLSATFDSKPAFTIGSKAQAQQYMAPQWATQFESTVAVLIPQGHTGFFDATLPSGAVLCRVGFLDARRGAASRREIPRRASRGSPSRARAL